ncbi:MAG TPA: alpha/beta hydrolase [Allosphingosinicella sp.]|nr:alpha/beta hydrolase [Allosphingosinicella sp.]
MATISDADKPRLGLFLREGPALAARLWRSFGSLEPRGPEGGPKLMVVPGFLANDRTTLGLQRALAGSGYRVLGWGLGLNTGVRNDTLDRLAARVGAFGEGGPVILVGWSLGGIYARELAKARPGLVAKVITLGSPFSGDPRANNVWRLYEWIAGHPVDDPPIKTDLEGKPPVPTLAIWSRWDGMVSVASARGEPGQSDRQIEVDSSHMGFAVSGRAFPKIVAAIRSF